MLRNYSKRFYRYLDIYKISLYIYTDYFFVIIIRIINCDAGVKDVSVHAGVYLTLHLDNKPKQTLWRLNTPQNQKYIKEEFNDHMADNNNGTVSLSILWDAPDAVVTGKRETQCGQIRRKRNSNQGPN